MEAFPANPLSRQTPSPSVYTGTSGMDVIQAPPHFDRLSTRPTCCYASAALSTSHKRNIGSRLGEQVCGTPPLTGTRPRMADAHRFSPYS